MSKVNFSERAIHSINQYSLRYAQYFEDLYSDTGVWGEDQIIENYRRESYERRQEIVRLLERRLSGETVLGKTPNNTLFIGWRSKILFVEWTESDDTRTITHLSIR